MAKDVRIRLKTERIVSIPRVKIRPFVEQPRTYFDPEALQGLADSIAEVGQLTPILVRNLTREEDDACTYELVDGQRRWHACELAQVDDMRAIVIDVESPADQFLISVASNFGRADHTPLEIARALKRVQAETGRNVRQLARVFGRSDSWIYQHLSLLELVPEVQAYLEPTVSEKQRLPMSVAVQIASLPAQQQVEVLTVRNEQGLTAQGTREHIRRSMQEKGLAPIRKGRSPKDDLRLLRGLVRRIERETDMFLRWPQSIFTAAFSSRTFEDHGAFLRDLRDRMAQLEVLFEAVKAAKKPLRAKDAEEAR